MLSKIQAQLKAPKNQYNSFGKYKYRSCEDIVEALKPILASLGGYIIMSDTVESVGGRNYVKATVTISVGDKTYNAHGYACEAETKKGMDSAQITGAASSYARKYALSGLLAIDDTKDADATNTHGKEAQRTDKVIFLNVKSLLMKAGSISELDSIISEHKTEIATIPDAGQKTLDTLYQSRRAEFEAAS